MPEPQHPGLGVPVKERRGGEVQGPQGEHSSYSAMGLQQNKALGGFQLNK